MTDLFDVDTSPERPYTFIQWKGTDVCLDFHCRCGASGHFDGDFAYNLRCTVCDTVWNMPIHLIPREGSADDGTVQDVEATCPKCRQGILRTEELDVSTPGGPPETVNSRTVCDRCGYDATGGTTNGNYS